jgi:hypothetical protein
VAAPDLKAVAYLGTQAVPQRESRAESLAFTGAQTARTTITFQVKLDKQGKPMRCTVIKHSGPAKLDMALCNAVMRAR